MVPLISKAPQEHFNKDPIGDAKFKKMSKIDGTGSWRARFTKVRGTDEKTTTSSSSSSSSSDDDERPCKDGLGSRINTKVITMFDLSKSHIIILFVGKNIERRLMKKDRQLQKRKSNNFLGGSPS